MQRYAIYKSGYVHENGTIEDPVFLRSYPMDKPSAANAFAQNKARYQGYETILQIEAENEFGEWQSIEGTEKHFS